MTDTGIDIPAPAVRRLDISSEQARRRIRARYRAEGRFKAYGLIALGVTALFLMLLVFDIIRNGVPAFTQNVLRMDVKVPPDLVAADKKSDAVAIRSADYFPITRDALLAAVPGIEGRRAQRTLTGLLSSGAATELQNRLVEEPSLMGKTVSVPLLLSDDADLYFKGLDADIKTKPGRGNATPTGTTGEVTILTSANDFAESVLFIKTVARNRIGELAAEKRRISLFGGASIQQRMKEIDDEIAALRLRVELAQSRGGNE